MKKIFSFLLAGVSLSLAVTAQAQRRCGNHVVAEKLAQKDPVAYAQYIAGTAQMRAAAQATPTTAAKGAAQYPIPVVFHIVVTQTMLNRMGGTAGVAQRVDSQMTVLNRDFNRKNSDSTLIPSVFKPLYTNVGIKFGLAKKTPSGATSPGYDIRIIPAGTDSTFDVATGSEGSTYACSDAKYPTRGLVSWDATRYLNIWVTEITYGGQQGILGVTNPPSFVPLGFPAGEIGITLTYEAFGKRRLPQDYYFGGIDLGRTLTHEMGHFFELNHIWGDDNGACPGGAGYSDDGIGDTPVQADENYSCPAFPHVSCAASSPNGDMFMNYMDYVDDRCMNMFSAGQRVVMQTQIASGGQSYSLTQQSGATYIPNAVTDVADGMLFSISPNPSGGLIHIVFGLGSRVQYTTITNSLGQAVYSARVAAGNTGMLSIDLSAVAKGIYFVKCTSETSSTTQKVVLQ